MSLLSTDITKVKRLSLKELRLPATKQREEPIKKEHPPTQEEIVYSKLVAKYPQIVDLVERLDLVSPITGQRIRTIDLTNLPPTEPLLDVDKLKALAYSIIEPENSYTKEEVIERIIKATKVSPDRANKGFNLLLQAGALEPTLGGSYYLTGSTPF